MPFFVILVLGTLLGYDSSKPHEVRPAPQPSIFLLTGVVVEPCHQFCQILFGFLGKFVAWL